ncbi:hypothetical protein VNO77_03826 [Canavalia gladiata]|uniref:Uncharacterized protein n=1 Tax=Canavalia gladiata TaxID=3824 RepID=A0AAN9R498_CANGL
MDPLKHHSTKVPLVLGEKLNTILEEVFGSNVFYFETSLLQTDSSLDRIFQSKLYSGQFPPPILIIVETNTASTLNVSFLLILSLWFSSDPFQIYQSKKKGKYNSLKYISENGESKVSLSSVESRLGFVNITVNVDILMLPTLPLLQHLGNHKIKVALRISRLKEKKATILGAFYWTRICLALESYLDSNHQGGGHHNTCSGGYRVIPIFNEPLGSNGPTVNVLRLSKMGQLHFNWGSTDSMYLAAKLSLSRAHIQRREIFPLRHKLWGLGFVLLSFISIQASFKKSQSVLDLLKLSFPLVLGYGVLDSGFVSSHDTSPKIGADLVWELAFLVRNKNVEFDNPRIIGYRAWAHQLCLIADYAF